MKKLLASLLAMGTLAATLTACGSSLFENIYDSADEIWDSAPATEENYYSYYDADGGYAYGAELADEDGLAYGDDSWRYAPIEPSEEYDDVGESPFKDVATSPLSTFSSDVDTASYSNMRRFITSGQQPQGVRIEELVNYFDYDYQRPAPNAEHPFTINAEVAPCPWNEEHLLAMVGIQGAELESPDIANNVVFLIDVSGSMDQANKLPLLKESFLLLLEQLGEKDTVSIVTYAGSDKVLADSLPGSDGRALKKIIQGLSAGGSTAGAKGILTAYELAEKNFIEGGNNRIILATDGDFNVGISSQSELTDLVAAKRETGVYLSVLGYGMGNYKDNRMEALADNGNGNYAYIDTIQEAQKVLVDEFDSMMYTIAEDLKLQVEFNPETVAQYRLIGYDNRRLENEDFNDDTKDAGDVGAGHSVTAFYELVPVGAETEADVDDLIYSSSGQTTGSSDFMTVKVRYKNPGEGESRLVQLAVGRGAYTRRPSETFQFASAVAEFGLLLTESQYRGGASLAGVQARAEANLGDDPFGLRVEFTQLVGRYRDNID